MALPLWKLDGSKREVCSWLIISQGWFSPEGQKIFEFVLSLPLMFTLVIRSKTKSTWLSLTHRLSKSLAFCEFAITNFEPRSALWYNVALACRAGIFCMFMTQWWVYEVGDLCPLILGKNNPLPPTPPPQGWILYCYISLIFAARLDRKNGQVGVGTKFFQLHSYSLGCLFVSPQAWSEFESKMALSWSK